MKKNLSMLLVFSAVLHSAAAPAPYSDDSAPIFHVGPAGCRGGTDPIGYGWTNDPNGPFEFQTVHHIFYQSRDSPGHPGGGDTYWGESLSVSLSLPAVLLLIEPAC